MQIFANNAEATLSAGINDTAGVIPVTSVALLPALPEWGYFYLTLIEEGVNALEVDWEVVKVTAINGLNLTVTRAQDNTQARAWAFGTKAQLRITAGTLDNLRQFQNIQGKPTTLSGYGITDANPETVGADPEGTAISVMTGHTAAVDPHPQYATPAEAAALDAEILLAASNDATTKANAAQAAAISAAATDATTKANAAQTASAPSVHSHAISGVTGLQPALDAKLDDSQAGTTGLSLLSAANAAAALTTLGLANHNLINVTDTYRVGIGVTSPAWGSGFRSVDFPSASVSDSGSGITRITSNLYNDGTNWRLRAAGVGLAYSQNLASGVHGWAYTNSGNAGDAVTSTVGMQFVSGRLVLGAPDDGVNLLQVAGSGKFTGAVASNDGRNGSITLGAYTTSLNRIISGLDYGGIVYDTDAGGGHTWRINAAEKLKLDPVGNLGLGVNPYAWPSTWKALELGSAGMGLVNNTNLIFVQGAYNDGSGWKCANSTSLPQRYVMDTTGGYSWYTSTSAGTTGAAVTMNLAMKLTSANRLLLNQSNDDGVNQFQCSGSGYFGGLTNTAVTIATTGSGQLLVGQYTNGAYIGTSSTDATAGILRLGTAGATKATLDTAGNLGLGVTPSAWYGTIAAMQFGTSGSIEGRKNNNSFLAFGTNYYLNSSANNTYIASVAAAKYVQDNGSHQWFTAPSGTAGAAISFTQAMTLDQNGNWLVGTTSGGYHRIEKPGLSAGQPVCHFGSGGGGIVFYHNDTGGANESLTGALFQKVGSTGRSINSAGTVNASGADYAEYERNNGLIISKGSVIGFKADGTLTLTYADAVRFGVKSTDPSYVGGDTWGSEDVVGKRPERPVREEEETDEAFSEREANYVADLSAWEARLEAERQTVDRIAYAGKVPVNVRGATPGGYIIAAAAPDGSIIGEFVADPDFAQYKRAVGRVNRILPDGRAEVAVMVH